MNTAAAICPAPPLGRWRIYDLAMETTSRWEQCRCCVGERTHQGDKCRTCNGWGVLVIKGGPSVCRPAAIE